MYSDRHRDGMRGAPPAHIEAHFVHADSMLACLFILSHFTEELTNQLQVCIYAVQEISTVSYSLNYTNQLYSTSTNDSWMANNLHLGTILLQTNRLNTIY